MTASERKRIFLKQKCKIVNKNFNKFLNIDEIRIVAGIRKQFQIFKLIVTPVVCTQFYIPKPHVFGRLMMTTHHFKCNEVYDNITIYFVERQLKIFMERNMRDSNTLTFISYLLQVKIVTLKNHSLGEDATLSCEADTAFDSCTWYLPNGGKCGPLTTASTQCRCDGLML